MRSKTKRRPLSERITVAARPDLAKRIDAAAESESMSRSTYIRRAVLEKLAKDMGVSQ